MENKKIQKTEIEKVTLVTNIKAKTPATSHHATQWLWYCVRQGETPSSGQFRPLIEQIRTETDKDQRNKLKRQLPAIIPTALLESDSSRSYNPQYYQNYSGLFCVDIDGLDDPAELARVREVLKQDPHTHLLFLSPSGMGLKVIVRVGGKERLDQADPKGSFTSKIFQGARHYYKENHGIVIDPSCKDITRLCYLSYDPDAFLNQEAPPLLHEAPLVRPKGKKGPTPTPPPNREQAIERVQALLNLTPDRIGSHDQWIPYCGGVSNFLQSAGLTPEEVLDMLAEKWPDQEGKAQLKHLVHNRKPTPIEKAEAIIEALAPEGWEEYSKKYQGHDNFWQRYCFNRSRNQMIDTATGQSFESAAFDRQHITKGRIKYQGERYYPSDYVAARSRTVVSVEYSPTKESPFYQDEFGDLIFNPYSPPKFKQKPTEEEIQQADEIINMHLHHLFRNEQHAALLKDYLASQVQHPGCLINWMIILYGVQGDGKSWFRELMEKTLGEKNVGIFNSISLGDQFANPSVGKCLTFIEELKLDNFKKYDILERLKGFIGNRRVNVRLMRREPYEANATANYLAATNHADSLPISPSERRFCVLETHWADKKSDLRHWVSENPQYYGKLYGYLAEHPGAFREALMRHEISEGFKNTAEAPITEATQRMIEEAIPAGAILLQNIIDQSGNQLVSDQIVELSELAATHKRLRDEGIVNEPLPGVKIVGRHLRELGYTMRDRLSVRTTGSKKFTFYHHPSLSQEAAREMVKERKQEAENRRACQPHAPYHH